MHRILTAIGLASTLFASGCLQRHEPVAQRHAASPASPSPITAANRTGHVRDVDYDTAGWAYGMAINFPPRDQAFEFRLRLEAVYRDSLRRGAESSFVDHEGTIVWITEYLRYRLNGCGHTHAYQLVMDTIDGRAPIAGCGSETREFPPRQEPLAFRLQLESKYRDGLHRSPVQSHVDPEGDVVWTQEYLRYRLSGCGHDDSATKVFDQLNGGGIARDCTPATPPPSPAPTPTPTAPAACSGTRPSNCSFEIDTTLVFPSANGGDFRGVDGIRVINETRPACTWSATSSTSWITILSPRGTVCPPTNPVEFRVSANSAFTRREGTFTVAGKTVQVLQDGRPVPLTLTIMDRNGIGSVSSNPSGLSCSVTQPFTSRTCTASFRAGTQVQLTAVPGAGSVINFWGGPCSGSRERCTIVMPTAPVETSINFIRQ